jgi:hypothetical protein
LALQENRRLTHKDRVFLSQIASLQKKNKGEEWELAQGRKNNITSSFYKLFEMNKRTSNEAPLLREKMVP